MGNQDHRLELSERLERIESALSGGRIPHVLDPPPTDLGWGGWMGWRWPSWRVPSRPIPEPVDPAPMDLSRLSKVQLELARETIKAQRIRLDALEQMINKQLKG